MRKKFTFLWALFFVLALSVLGAGRPVEAASKKAVRAVAIRIDNKKATKKTYTLEVGKSKILKVTVSPKKAAKSIRYKSSSLKIVSLSKKGKITAKKKGTAKIQITVTGKNKKKKSTWVKVKVVNPRIKSVSVRIDNKNVAGRAYSLERGGWKDLKVNAAPAKAVKSIRYASSNTRVANVDRKGTVIARNTGTARITVTAVNKDNKKKSVWVDIKVTDGSPAPTPTPDPNPDPEPTPEPGTSNILIAYFSLAENTENSTNVDATTSASIVVDNTGKYGTTEYIAHMIQKKVGGDLHSIQTRQSYPDDFDAVVDQNHQEMQDGVLPELVQSNLDISRYDTVFIGYPVWATNAPQAVLSFLNQYDMSGKKVIPFCTHDGYGAGSSYQTISNACPQTEVLSGIAIEAKDVSIAESMVNNWLAEIGITGQDEKDDTDKNRVLVAYFSATNTTEKLAGYLSDGLGADLYEIVPTVPYTSADLNYGDSNSRTSIEMNDPNARPEISGSVANMEQYDIVFIGYPIWWGQAPRIVSTFLESYDFSGKTIIPFCTSGSSGIGSSATNLHSLTSGANWLSGNRLDGGSSREEIVDWVNGLGLDVTAK